MNDLKGKNVIVTGGSRGIGSEIVKLLAEHGANLAFTYTSGREPAETVLKSLPTGNHRIGQMDLSQEDSIQSFFEETLKDWGTLDGLVNNAGITQDGLLLRMKSEDFDKVINTNLRGTFLCSKIASKLMLKARKGSIVHITSVIGQTGNAGQVNYAASKAGIEAMSKSIALELASRSVRSNCVAPGFIETEMTKQLTDEQRNNIFQKVPLQRIGTGRDVAWAVAYLLSDVSNYVTGTTINVNGGLYS